jgi:hypothetical protein
MPLVYLTSPQREKLRLQGPSVVDTDKVIQAMIATGNDNLSIPGLTNAIGSIVEVRVLNEGSGYSGGPYSNVSLVDTGSATGLFATADFVVQGGKLVMEVIQNGGQAYKKGDQLAVSSGDVGGGIGWLCEVMLVDPQ